MSGGTQQFTAMVTGTTNTGVTWTATSGSISSSGLFTAPTVSTSAIVTVAAASNANLTVVKTSDVTVIATTPPPPTGNPADYTGTGTVASWKAYQYKDTDFIYHQALEIYSAKGAYPVIGYSYFDAGCTQLGDTFNDYWEPLGNGLWWFIHQPNLVYVKWVWYDNVTNKTILQQTPCLDYSAAPRYN